MKKTNYKYALREDWSSEIFFERDSESSYKIKISNDKRTEFKSLQHSRYTWLISFFYKSRSKKKQGSIAVSSKNNITENSQYFEENEEGIRFLNLSGLMNSEDAIEEVTLSPSHCDILEEAKILAFKIPNFSNGPILIIAPHADDAELAAYGLYSDNPSNTWITTINAGQKVQSLKKQYIPRLDDNLIDATERKAQIRAWNSMTTPLLAGLTLDNLSTLGYFGLTKNSLYKHPDQKIVDENHHDLSPSICRSINKIKLPSDDLNINTGKNLIKDIVFLLEKIKPSIVLVTDPEIDPHPEHIMSAHALALAIEKSNHTPKKILMYANHLQEIKNFPYGPEHSITALPPYFNNKSLFGHFSCYSHQLTMKTQKDKVVAFDSMHDLRSKPRLQKNIKIWWNRKVLKNNYFFYGYHSYFMTHIKANEVFTVVEGRHFSESLIKSSKP